MADLVNEFSWSMSRAAKLGECPRAYYYHYYASWGGWERGADPEVHELWILKKLTGRKAWAGSEVHDTIAWALGRVRSGGELPSADEAASRMHRRMQDGFRASREGLYRRRKALGLVEHEYDEDLPDEAWADNWSHAKRCLEAFYGGEALEEILSVDVSRWFPIDALDTFQFEGVKIFVAPDFAFEDDAGKTRILDWKTGRPREKDRSQVRGYVLFAMDRWGTEPGDAVAELHYLGLGEVDRVDVTKGALESFKDEMRASIAAMRSGLEDPAGNVAEKAAFPPVSEQRACGRCNFRRVCPDAAL